MTLNTDPVQHVDCIIMHDQSLEKHVWFQTEGRCQNEDEEASVYL